MDNIGRINISAQFYHGTTEIETWVAKVKYRGKTAILASKDKDLLLRQSEEALSELKRELA